MEKHSSNLNNGSKVKLLCSYGGKIQSRPTDHQLFYVGGDIKILAVDRTVKFSEIIARLNSLSNRNDGGQILVKYQLPGEDLDALVSLIDDEDVEHMMVEYDRMQRISTRPARLRIFVFDISARPDSPVKSGVIEPNSVTPQQNPDYLFGFDKEYQPSIGPPLDLLQIQGITPPENYNNVSVNGLTTAAGAPQMVYLVPAVVNGGGMYRSTMVNGNWEQPVYNYIPAMPPLPEPRMNSMEVKVNNSNFLL